MLLTGCANRTELVATQVVVKLPPAGLIVPCHKPEIQGTSPLITASEDVPTNNTSAIPNPATTAMGPNYVHDRRRRKDKFPVLLKRFRKYIEDHG